MPGLTFTIPNHHDELQSRASSVPKPDETTLAEQAHHTLPSFDVPTSSPVLYLPPLLSSLPASFPSHAPESAGSEFPPLTTETRLPDIDPASLSLHRALHHFRPLDEHYASKPYDEAFNWSDLRLPVDEEREWYCVAFRSFRREGSDGHPLYEADKAAHEEAVRNGGLIMYWYGVPSPETGFNLATCIWQSRTHAVQANSRPKHIVAAKLAQAAYAKYDLERWVLRKCPGEEGVRIERYVDGPVGW